MTIIINGMKIEQSTRFEYITNPKRAGSKAHHRYGIYEEATNLEEYDQLCSDGDFSKYAKADLRYDTEKGHLILFGDDDVAMKPNLPVDTSTPKEEEEVLESDSAEYDKLEEKLEAAADEAEEDEILSEEFDEIEAEEL